MTKPPTCPDEDDFVALLEHRLPQEEERLLDEHIDRCERCMQLVANLADQLVDHAPGHVMEYDPQDLPTDGAC